MAGGLVTDGRQCLWHAVGRGGEPDSKRLGFFRMCVFSLCFVRDVDVDLGSRDRCAVVLPRASFVGVLRTV
jgi:hypothetical protein